MNMSLKILLPFKVFADLQNVYRIVAETENGYYGFLPKRLDCVLPLVPGIFTYENEEGSHYAAVDEGIMVKVGQQVLVSVRNAIGGVDLGKLKESVERDYLTIDEEERNSRSMMAKLESNFIKSLERLRKG
jgi:F-type H+-transporting ATPase subunit epsilon